MLNIQNIDPASLIDHTAIEAADSAHAKVLERRSVAASRVPVAQAALAAAQERHAAALAAESADDPTVTAADLEGAEKAVEVADASVVAVENAILASDKSRLREHGKAHVNFRNHGVQMKLQVRRELAEHIKAIAALVEKNREADEIIRRAYTAGGDRAPMLNDLFNISWTLEQFLKHDPVRDELNYWTQLQNRDPSLTVGSNE